MLSLTNINKKYGSHEVLNFDEWKIGQGVHWLKGGNGTGKSTLFRIISGQSPFRGEVELNEINLKKQPILFRSKISFAEAEPQYPLFIKGKELIEFYQETRKSEKKEVEYLTDYFEMTAFLDNKIGGYSSGMLKKLSLICAFLGKADLYILDEPLITIDATSSEKLYYLIKTKASKGNSFLISSHQEINQVKLPLNTVFQIIDKQIVATHAEVTNQ
ncbi:ATP-binding cassette domain-containing protein [Albibacterium sp.]|uniref:ATP-binding cassette domain-containing protein n=1 Tax=Albibacterium sp. TaxID=2952885 RepID=UPI002B701FCB|nr:ATP-binding cassette domain-containing protein [Albibacterium sp.]HUH19622.1 ATP-binding cassette domain-containing protein [Albibacterium sp.]